MNIQDETAPRFLITRLSHIGDCVLTLPLVNAIKKANPGAFVAWAMESPTHKLLGDHPSIDQIVNVPKGWLKSPFKWRQLKKELKELKIDIVLDPQSLTKSSMLGKLSGAKTRVGFTAPYAKEFSAVLNTDFVKATQAHLVDRTLELLSHPKIQIDKGDVEFRLPIELDDHETMVSWLKQNDLDKFIAINPGASWVSKRWVTKRFGYVARYAYQAHEIKSVVTWAGEEEKAMAQRIVDQSQGAAVLAPSTSLSKLAALLRSSNTFLGCDTGPMHIAAATGTQCIVLHGPTLPGRSGAYGPQHIPIQRWHQNDRNRRRAGNLAMRDITVDDVCCALDKIYSSSRQIAVSAA